MALDNTVKIILNAQIHQVPGYVQKFYYSIFHAADA